MTQPPPAGGEDYLRGHEAGVVAGQIDARLAGHDHHFVDINGQLRKLTQAVSDLTMAVQHLSDQADSAAATAIALAAALKAAEERRWGPWQRAGAVVATVAAIIGTALGVRAAYR